VVTSPGCLLHVVRGRPLTVHASLANPPGAEEDVRVPALLAPLGAFWALAVTDADGRPVYETQRPKLKLKLDPASPESYVVLRPGATYGVVLAVDRDDLWLEPGEYTVRASYGNGDFTGPAGDPIGRQACSATAELRV
jgi:hypothetical protein